MIVIYLSLALVCTLLTAFEFLLGTIAILSLRATIFGFWLFKLHRKKVVPLRVFQKPYYTIGIEVVGLLTGAWFALFIALTEYRLSESFFVQNSNLVPSRYCQYMNASFNEDVLSESRPPSQYVIDEASMDIAKQVSCPYGISSLDFGTQTKTETASDFGLAPKCVDKNNSISASDVPVVISNEIVFQYETEFSMRMTNFHIIPYRLPNNGFSGAQRIENAKTTPTPLPECSEKRIESNTVAIAYPRWRVREVDDFNISRSIVKSICEGQNESFSSITLAQAKKSECVNDFGFINQICLYQDIKNGTIEGEIYSITLDNLSALMSVQNGTEEEGTFFRSLSYACVDASVKVEYTFISNRIIPDIFFGTELPMNRSHSFVFPLRVTVLSGQCERTMHALALPALIYSTKAEWASQQPDLVKEVLKMERQQRFHAYMVSLARFNFAVEGISNPENLTKGCEFEKAVKGTRMDTDAIFVVLVVTLSVCTLLILFAVVFKCIIPMHAWEMADYANRITFKDIKNSDSSINTASGNSIGKGALRTFQSGQSYGTPADGNNPNQSSILISVEDEEVNGDAKSNPLVRRRGLFSTSVYNIKTVKTDQNDV